MKRVATAAMMTLIMLAMVVTPVFATGPTGAGGESGYAPPAIDQSTLVICPHSRVPVGTATTIWEDDVTITISAIPEGAHMLLNWSRAWEAATYPEAPYYTGEWTEQAWCQYSFWLNGSGPVTITRDDGVNPTVEEVTEFIFFKVQHVGSGGGNSDFDAGRNIDVTIQAYK